jgi:hypothetical protein
MKKTRMDIHIMNQMHHFERIELFYGLKPYMSCYYYYYYTQVGRPDSFSGIQFGPRTDHQLSEFLAGDGECTRH